MLTLILRSQYPSLPHGASKHGSLPAQRPLPAHWKNGRRLLHRRQNLRSDRRSDVFHQFAIRVQPLDAEPFFRTHHRSVIICIHKSPSSRGVF